MIVKIMLVVALMLRQYSVQLLPIVYLIHWLYLLMQYSCVHIQYVVMLSDLFRT